MGYGEIDQKAINTIRVLAVSSPLFTLFYFPPPRAHCIGFYPATLAPPSLPMRNET